MTIKRQFVCFRVCSGCKILNVDCNFNIKTAPVERRVAHIWQRAVIRVQGGVKIADGDARDLAELPGRA